MEPLTSLVITTIVPEENCGFIAHKRLIIWSKKKEMSKSKESAVEAAVAFDRTVKYGGR